MIIDISNNINNNNNNNNNKKGRIICIIGIFCVFTVLIGVLLYGFIIKFI